MIKALKKMKETFNEELEYLTELLESGSEFSKLAEYLLTTDRNPYSILNEGYDKEEISSFNDMLRTLNHALYDDGDVTFYTVNGEPRFGFFEKDVPKNRFLSNIQIEIEIQYDKPRYSVEVLPINISNWIELSEAYRLAEIEKYAEFEKRKK